MTSRDLVTLGEIADLQWGDTSVTKKSYVSTGDQYPAYSASGQDGYLPYFDYDRIGVVLSAIGANAGKTWLASGQWSCIKNTIRFFSIDESVADTRYLFWATQGQGTFPLRGSAQPFISQGDARKVTIRLPLIEEQRAIAATLGALDDKIDSNRRAISLIGELVAARFASITEQGRASLQPLGELTELVRGRSYTSAELSECDVALVTLKSINRNGGYKSNGLKPYTGIYKPEQIITPGEIVVAQTDLTQGAEVVGRGVRVPSSSIAKVLVASLDLVIVRPLDSMPIEYLFGLLTTEAFREHCRSRVTGTTVLHLAKDAIPSWPAPVVNRAEQLKFSGWASDLFSRMDALSSENDRLLATRDALIPGLLSGAIRVSEAEVSS
ncbi:restriction endonuclease subunit S [Microbacterium sp. 22215]|uniref:restriction endonuclease subunit S n=1 Tax=Microbacterium sp. 22215 TaxID=3453893 RepID=UPI003F83D6C6